MTDVIVTIGRENGSGGREIGRILADRLGIPCYDHQIVQETAVQAGMSVEDVGRTEERDGRTMLFFGGIPTANPLYDAQSRAVESLASQGPCVFVGRCADYVLRDRPGLVRVFVHAPMEDRVRRSAERNGVSAESARRHIEETDEERARYYMRHTGLVWGSASNYDLTVNTGRIGVDGAVRVILEYVEALSQ